MIAAILAISTGCTSHHAFMDNAVVGIVDNAKVVVMFEDSTKDGVKYYRPQFGSDCPYNKAYDDDSNSTTCLIRETRITQMDSYNHHKQSGKVLKPSIRNEVVHETIEGTNSSTQIPDNI